jgi:hypothetical protein
MDPTGEGKRALEEALALYEEIGDQRGVGNALWGMGNMNFFHDDPEKSADRFRMALSAFRSAGDRTMEAWSLHMLGGSLLRLGRAKEAREDLAEALRHFQETSDTAGITLALGDLATAALAMGDGPRAARLRGASRRLTQATGAGLATINEMWTDLGDLPTLAAPLSPEELERYAREGAAMTLDDVIAYALSGVEAPAASGGS